MSETPFSLHREDIRTAAQRSVLCWLATVDSQGQPNVSPKEIFAVFDEQHLVVANLASPSTVRNLRHSCKVCISFIDVFVQKGFKVLGSARNIEQADPEFSRWAAPLIAMAGSRFPVRSVIVIRATACDPIVAPSYRLYPHETTEPGQVASALRTYGVVPLKNSPEEDGA